MPWTLDTPEANPYSDDDITTVLYQGLIVDNVKQRIMILYEEGFLDGDFVKVRSRSYLVEKQAFLDAIALKPDGDKTYYENLKEWGYAQLFDNGVISAGTLT
jgi:hypothetical protein